VKSPTFLPDFKQIRIFSTDFSLKVPKIKFHENPCSRSRSGTCGQTDRQTDRRTDIAKLIGAFREYANPPKVFWIFRWFIPAVFEV